MAELGTVLLVDGTGLMVRCNRAGAARHLMSQGVRTAALLMFISSLARQIREQRPGHLLVAWDGPDACAPRREACPCYKAGRPLPPSHGDVERAREFCAAARICQVSLPRFEADDVIAFALRRAQAELPGAETVICSADADCYQLLGPGSWQWRFGTPATDRFTQAHAEEFYGCSGARLPMLRALAGDASDSIPGIRGYGLKRGLAFLQATGWAWPPDFGDHRLSQAARIYREVLTLIDSPWQAETSPALEGFSFCRAATWQPESDGNVRDLLKRYEMNSLLAKFDKGSLW